MGEKAYASPLRHWALADSLASRRSRGTRPQTWRILTLPTRRRAQTWRSFFIALCASLFFASRTSLGLAEERRVLARWGWVGENDSLFEHPEVILVLASNETSAHIFRQSFSTSGYVRSREGVLSGNVNSATADLSRSPFPICIKRRYWPKVARATGSERPAFFAKSSAMAESFSAWAAEK